MREQGVSGGVHSGQQLLILDLSELWRAAVEPQDATREIIRAD